MKTTGDGDCRMAPASQPRRRPNPARACLGTAFRGIMRGLAADLAREDDEGPHAFEAIHRRRVTIRRLRSMIALFSPCLDPVEAVRFGRALRDLGRAYSAARDWDVACLKTFPAATAGAPVTEAAAIVAAADAVRRRAHESLDNAGAPGDAMRLARDLRAWVSGASCMRPGCAGRRLAAVAPALLHRLDQRVIRRGRGIGNLSHTELHALRKALKRLNYGIEALAPLFPPASPDDVRAPCVDLLAQLGRFNDAVAARVLASEIADDHVPVEAFVRPWAKRRRRKAKRRLPSVWRAFRAAPRPWNEACTGGS